ncbi:chromosome partitioning protein [Actinomadura montaniterrae]|uniref:Chromosome partitioning protein n=1 Tax=Actinomadura montaniterrae TaxID=1803903 RepID=A0A6L3WEP1_9ACTN|nr:chromosome partitioning protein [Actinomadura montaniterrae]KAB2390486.1 chromosome partitioning protein [Actinomadura montaniterrae]
MTGLELAAAGAAAAWLWRKWRRVAGRADAEVDAALDAGMDRLHEVVAVKLGPDTALMKLQQEAREGEADEPPPVTLERVRLAIADAAADDADFGAAVDDAVASLEEAARVSCKASAGDHGLAAGGNVRVSADRNSLAGGVVDIDGAVSLGTPPVPPNPQLPGPERD